MTFSIIARDPATGSFGIAVATKFFAVGARVPHIASGIGAVATQALLNPFYGVDGLKLLREGKPAAEVVRILVDADAGRDHRQVHATNAALSFPRRLIAALKAGEAAGGDKRGKQSAALRIHGEEEWSDLDLRVDDHSDPLAELERLERVSREHWMHFRKALPSRRDPVGIVDRTVINAEIAKARAAESAP